jgi:protease IV
MKKNPWLVLLSLVLVFGVLFTVFIGASVYSFFGGSTSEKVASKHSILKLKLTGIIYDSEKFLKNLKKYSDNDHIKAIVIEINSPGGVVGPSQEIYSEILRIKKETKKPVIAVSTGLLASGAYYAAVAADKIVVQPGTLVGSIGVIMEFINLENLYDWAKVKRYTITTGKFKDSGAEYRAMRDDERQLFQELVNDTWEQFKSAVAEGRQLAIDKVTPYADGRIMSGSQAVKLGFADQIGSTHDAYELAAKIAGVDNKYEIFEPPKPKPSLMEYFAGGEQEDASTSVNELVEAYTQKGKMSPAIQSIFQTLLKTHLANKPLYLMPGAWD